MSNGAAQGRGTALPIEITVKNYRCFHESKPALITLRDGFTSYVGLNNTGKSAILRLLYEFKKTFEQIGDPHQLPTVLSGQHNITLPPNAVSEFSDVIANESSGELEIDVRVIDPSDTHPVEIVIKCTGPNRMLVQMMARGRVLPTEVYSVSDRQMSLSNNRGVVATVGNMLDACTALGDTMYVGAFRNAISAAMDQPYFDVSVGHGFVREWHMAKTGPGRRKNEATLRVAEQIRDIFSFRAFEINASHDQKTLTLAIDGRSFRLSEVGSGLAQFILVLGTAALKQPSFILIDEPELNLHPSLQLDFLTALASHAKRGVLFTTHSYGLARAASDYVYTVIRDRDGHSEIFAYEQTPRLSELLGELNYSGYSALGYETVLLVEGPTEVRTIQQFLRFYRKEHQIVLVPLGGDSMINANTELQLQELKRITSKVFALIDSERGTSSETLSVGRQGFVDACKRAGITCHVLERRATENYLSERAIRLIKRSDKYRALTPFEKLKDVSPAWGKQENWLIAREMTKAEVDATDLGRFLTTL